MTAVYSAMTPLYQMAGLLKTQHNKDKNPRLKIRKNCFEVTNKNNKPKTHRNDYPPSMRKQNLKKQYTKQYVVFSGTKENHFETHQNHLLSLA